MNEGVDRRSLVLGSMLLATPAARASVIGAQDAVPARTQHARPASRQIRWHRREQYGFVHFGLNTFTGREWGYGDEDPKLFDPTDFDADAIVAAMKSAELNGIILTAKHHDGFCLWPTPLTEHCIRNAPYKGGKGDLVREMSDACARAKMPFGIYLSPWDRNRADYGTPAYIDYYRAQLTDLCTNYGELFEVWFDGANGGDGYYGGAREARKIDAGPYYDWPAMRDIVRRHQPWACIFGPSVHLDIRWVGNERGLAPDPCWPTVPAGGGSAATRGSGVKGAPHWRPAECDVSIRKGWFHRPEEDATLKTAAQLMALHDRSVGRGANLLINVAPDRTGRIPAADRQSLKAFGDILRATYRHDLAARATARATSTLAEAQAAANVLSPDRSRYWSPRADDGTAALTVDLDTPVECNTIRIREYIHNGVTIGRFAVDIDEGSGWRTLAERESIIGQRILRFDAVMRPRRIRLRILEALQTPAIERISLHKSPVPTFPDPVSGHAREAVALPAKIVNASAPGAEGLTRGSAMPWSSPLPASVTFDLGRTGTIGGLSITPTSDASGKGAPPARFVLEVSGDGERWTRAGAGEFSNIAAARTAQTQRLAAPADGRFVRVTFPATATGDPMLTLQAMALLP